MILNKDQIEKLFHLAGIDIKEEINSDDISLALIEIEKKLVTCSYSKSELELEYNPSILVIDDLELSIHQLNLLFTKSGFNVHVARSADEAIQQFQKHNYDYVLLDLFIPEPENGLGILESFANSDKSRENKTKVIVISGTDNKDLISKCFLKGASEFVEKAPEWHKKILHYINTMENKKKGFIPEFVTKIEDSDRKIVSINVNNLGKDNIAQELEKEIMTLVNSGFNNIILDLKNISEITSRGIAALIFGYKTCTENNGCFKLCNVKSSVDESLSYVFLQNIINIYKDKDAALVSYRE